MLPLDGGYTNHNYYIYEDDSSNFSKREFRLVPWDLTHVLIFRGMLAEVSVSEQWEKPVCQELQGSEEGKACTRCDGAEEEIPASCFKIFRAFARGMRSWY